MESNQLILNLTSISFSVPFIREMKPSNKKIVIAVKEILTKPGSFKDYFAAAKEVASKANEFFEQTGLLEDETIKVVIIDSSPCGLLYLEEMMKRLGIYISIPILEDGITPRIENSFRLANRLFERD